MRARFLLLFVLIAAPVSAQVVGQGDGGSSPWLVNFGGSAQPVSQSGGWSITFASPQAVTQSGTWSISFTAPQHVIVDSAPTTAVTNAGLTALTTSGGGGYVRQDSTDTIAKESGGNLDNIAIYTQGTNDGVAVLTEATSITGNNAGASGNQTGYVTFGVTNDATPKIAAIPLGPIQASGAGRAVIVEGTGTFGVTAAAGAIAANAVSAGAFGSGAIASGAVAAGAFASGALAFGSVADGAVATLGIKADAKSTATDTTSVSIMSVLKEISAMEQAPALPSGAALESGNLASLVALITSVIETIGTTEGTKNLGITGADALNVPHGLATNSGGVLYVSTINNGMGSSSSSRILLPCNALRLNNCR